MEKQSFDGRSPSVEPRSSIWGATKVLSTIANGVAATLGILVAVLSLTSIVQHWGQFNLASVSAQVLDYYRSIRDAGKWAIVDWWASSLWSGWTLPGWILDVVNIWLLSAFATIRGNSFVRKSGAMFGRRVLGFWISVPMSSWAAVASGPIALLGFLAALKLYWPRQDLNIGDTVTEIGDELVTRKTTHEDVARHLYGIKRQRQSIIVVLAATIAPIVGTIVFFVWNALSL